MSEPCLKVTKEEGGKLLVLRLNRPKANIVDAEMIKALSAAFAEATQENGLRAVLLSHEGPHFSFGASVQEHLPGQCAEMLKALHSLVKQMLNCPLPILVAIKGQCLGGGLEVAAAGDILYAAPTAKLGQPEIQLAVFAPAASCLLPSRIGEANARDLLFSGRSVGGDEALRMGLVNQVAEEPEAALIEYFRQNLAKSSASSLRFAVKAARMGNKEAVETKLDQVEALYLNGLMATKDAVEGLTAFLEKRQPQWED